MPIGPSYIHRTLYIMFLGYILEYSRIVRITYYIYINVTPLTWMNMIDKA